MKIGVAYYPEQWPEEHWAIDARLMRQSGIDLVRIGEFTWSRLEPRRERIDVNWLERAVGVLAAEGLKVIMCTPTAAPPPWLFNRHPDIVPQDVDGRRWYAGSRRHVCLNHAAYRKYARRIVIELAKSFASNPDVYAWQIDNELGAQRGAVCYCDECEQAFRRWLKLRYGIIERLNNKWGTAFWSQHFADWHEIPAPRRTPAGPHPSLLLDYKRFVSATCRSFVTEQSKIIRDQGGEGVIITTNGPGGAPHLNQFSLAGAQDVVALSNYPGADSRLDLTAYELDLARSVKRKPFWVLEQQAGATLCVDRPAQPRPGQLRLWSYQAAARGAELITYFRWRTAAFGQEMHWYGMLDPEGGTEGRRFEELRQTIRELKEHAHLWQRRLPEAHVAIVLDYDSAWALEATPMGLGLDYFSHVRTLYQLLRRMGAQVDFVEPGAELTPYRAVIVPMPFICTEAGVDSLSLCVNNGRSVLVTAPAGYKTPENTAVTGAPPARLSGLLGVEVVEHDVLSPGDSNTVSLKEVGKVFPTGRFCSVMELRGARAIATYGAQYYTGSPAITCRTVGQGRAFFVGALCGPQCYGAVMREVLASAGVRLCEWASENVEAVPLTGSSGSPQLTFVLNHSEQAATLTLPAGANCQDMLTGREFDGTVTLEGYQVVLLSL